MGVTLTEEWEERDGEPDDDGGRKGDALRDFAFSPCLEEPFESLYKTCK